MGACKNIILDIEFAGGVKNRIKQLQRQIKNIEKTKPNDVRELRKLTAELEIVKEYK